ncbi:LAME_0D10682g1_1 [Lachancea meyersii CBS 8951]|uniref:DNA ligase n=1 Tax=Lachancea meyersii CBS 8951 TaxID=1266667 RepID=A0A1G4JC14_9SACH|nr:LAME_0D10682g1_1 [Lachancea meyersii CBS 8951]
MVDSIDQLSQNSSQLSEEYKPKNFAPSPDFRWLCDELLAKLDDINKNRLKYGKSVTVKNVETIIYFIKLWRTTVGNDFFPVLRLILPYRDIRTYNIKDFTLIKAICKSLNLPRDSPTEKKLINWKQYAARGTNLSAFCVEEIAKRRKEPEVVTAMSIDKLNEVLNELSKEASTKKWGFTGLSDSPSFKYCLQNMSFLELRYFFDVILKVRVIGGLEHKFLSCWHPDAQDYLGVVSDLKVLADKLWDPLMRLGRKELSINLGHAFAPHLAKRLHISYEKVCAKLKNDFLLEEKMDGERIQLHYMENGGRLRFLSRRGTDYTHLYGESIHRGVISQFLKFREEVNDCVLDGEMVSFDKERKVVLPFGIVKTAAVEEIINASSSIEKEGYRPLYMVFDLVYLNGVSLTRLPLHARKEYLRQIITPVPDAVEIVSALECTDHTAIETSLQRAIEMGSEGLILKQRSSTYDVGARNDQWVKIKPEYFEDLGENMDLIIIGRDPGKKDSLMCGLVTYINDTCQNGKIPNLDGDKESDLSNLKVFSFCNVANGVSDAEFKEIERKTRGHWKSFAENPPPSDLLEFGTKLPNEWIDPRSSLVLEVKARSADNNLISRKKYKVGSTLHGAYCRRIRDDKDWTACATVEQYLQAKIAHNYRSYKKKAHQLSPRKKKVRKFVRLDDFESDAAENASQESSLFEGMRFYILGDYVDSDGQRYDKRAIANQISRNGGLLMHNMTVKPEELSHLWIVGRKATIECKSLFDRGYDIVDPSWVFDCISAHMRLNLEPKHCFYASSRLLENSRKRVDNYGDSFCRPLNNSEYDQLIQNSHENIEEHSQTFSELEEAPLFMLQRYKIFVAKSDSVQENLGTVKKTIEQFGGRIAENIRECNLVLSYNPTESDPLFGQTLRKQVATEFVQEYSQRNPIPRIVNYTWLKECLKEECLVPEEDYPCL